MSGFHEIQFPLLEDWGVEGGVGFRTEITELDSGFENRVSMWDGGRNQYKLNYTIRSTEDLLTVQSFFRARRGAAYGFRLQDQFDFHTDPDDPSYKSAPGTEDQDCSPEVGDGSNLTFLLAKKYISGATVVTRRIFKPVSGMISVWVNSVLLTEGVDYSIDYTSGTVTMASAPTLGHTVKWSGEFDVPVRASAGVDRLLSMTLDEYDSGAIPDLEMIEILSNEGGYIGEFFYGGSLEKDLYANYSLVTGEAFLYRLDPQTSGLSVILPDPTNLPDGRPLFTVINASGSQSLTVKHSSLSTLLTLSAGQGIDLLVHKSNGSGTKAFIGV